MLKSFAAAAAAAVVPGLAAARAEAAAAAPTLAVAARGEAARGEVRKVPGSASSAKFVAEKQTGRSFADIVSVHH